MPVQGPLLDTLNPPNPHTTVHSGVHDLKDQNLKQGPTNI